MAKLGITIRIGAAYDQIETADGRVFDRSTMTDPQKKKVARLIREIFKIETKGTDG